LAFAKKHIEVGYEISGTGARAERFKYPTVAIREALVNALVHRDYSFQNSCVYLNIFSNRLEIENPGGIPGNESVEGIEGKSLRRNPLLAELLFRAGYGEKLGSGLLRIKEVLKENNNPNYLISATNFFSIRFLPRVELRKSFNLTSRKQEIISYLRSAERDLSSQELANIFNLSTTTIFRELKELITLKLVLASGNGRSTRYRLDESRELNT